MLLVTEEGPPLALPCPLPQPGEPHSLAHIPGPSHVSSFSPSILGEEAGAPSDR